MTSAWVLKVATVLLTALTVAGSGLYVLANVKNPYAPLHPTVLKVAPPASAPPGRPVLEPSVRVADLPALTFTYVS